jgi:hypothetical protein
VTAALSKTTSWYCTAAEGVSGGDGEQHRLSLNPLLRDQGLPVRFLLYPTEIDQLGGDFWDELPDHIGRRAEHLRSPRSCRQHRRSAFRKVEDCRGVPRWRWPGRLAFTCSALLLNCHNARRVPELPEGKADRLV